MASNANEYFISTVRKVKSMNARMRIFLLLGLVAAVVACENSDNGTSPESAEQQTSAVVEQAAVTPPVKQAPIVKQDYFVSDSLYYWNEQFSEWMVVKEAAAYQAQFATYKEVDSNVKEPIAVAWEDLVNIRYKLRYFSEVDMEIYAPVFPDEVRALDGKEIIIDGFVIPFDEEDELLSLSQNPYASCFFCGKASPASVMSMYLKNKRKRYKMDDFKSFRGTLELNSDDPNNFYYILRDAKEERRR